MHLTTNEHIVTKNDLNLFNHITPIPHVSLVSVRARVVVKVCVIVTNDSAYFVFHTKMGSLLHAKLALNSSDMSPLFQNLVKIAVFLQVAALQGL